MGTRAPEDRERFERQLAEIDAQLANLKLDCASPAEERVKVRVKLTRAWLATFQKLTGRPV